MSRWERSPGISHDEKGSDGSKTKLTSAPQEYKGRCRSIEVGEYHELNFKR